MPASKCLFPSGSGGLSLCDCGGAFDGESKAPCTTLSKRLHHVCQAEYEASNDLVVPLGYFCLACLKKGAQFR